MNRPKTYTIAAILQGLFSLYAMVTTIPLLARGDTAPTPPFFIIVIGFALAVLGIISAYGVWRNDKWGVVLTIIVRAIDGLGALPGLLFAPTLALQISAWVSVLFAIVIIALLLWPKPKAVQAANQATRQ